MEHISVAVGGPKRTFERAVGEAVTLGVEIDKVQNELFGGNRDRIGDFG